MQGNFNSIIQDARPVLVDFHAQWCGPCKMQSPVLKQVASEMGDRIRVIKIDVDINPEIASKYGIQGVPTLMVFKDGELKYKQAGVHDRSRLINILNQI
jgi:thioredoxin 1